jgi:hypothetical protein
VGRAESRKINLAPFLGLPDVGIIRVLLRPNTTPLLILKDLANVGGYKKTKSVTQLISDRYLGYVNLEIDNTKADFLFTTPEGFFQFIARSKRKSIKKIYFALVHGCIRSNNPELSKFIWELSLVVSKDRSD